MGGVESVSHRFFDLLERSIIVQSTITLALIIACLYLWCAGRPVPTLLENLTMIVVAFWMGSKTQHTVDRTAQLGRSERALMARSYRESEES
jgi:hypothetical protein